MSDGVKRYGGASETQLVRAEAISQIVASQTALMEKRSVRINLNDLSDVRQAVKQYTDTCAECGVLPTMEGLAAILGHSRQNFYKYLRNHPDTETASFLDSLRTAWAAMRIAAADRGAASESISIFVLLNSNLDFTNEHKIAIEPVRTPLAVSPEEVETIRRKYITALPEKEPEKGTVL